MSYDQISSVTKRDLPVQLTESEFVDRSTELAVIGNEIVAMETKRAKIAADMKEEIGGKLNRQRELRHIVIDKREERSVPCKWTPDWTAREVTLVRQDTYETVDSRTMTSDELQRKIEYDDQREPEPRADADAKGETVTDDDHLLPENTEDDEPEYDPETGEYPDGD